VNQDYFQTHHPDCGWHRDWHDCSCHVFAFEALKSSSKYFESERERLIVKLQAIESLSRYLLVKLDGKADSEALDLIRDILRESK
jgi:hypothetical protein